MYLCISQILLTLLIVMEVASGSCQVAESADINQLTKQGSNLTEQQARKLEREVIANPDDLAMRTILLVYYTTMAGDSPSAQSARQQLILWLIENHPDAEILGTHWASLNPWADGNKYDEAKRQWLKQVDVHPKNVVILGNAAIAMMSEGSDKSREFLEQCKSLQPKNAKWPEQLACWYDSQAYTPPSKQDAGSIELWSKQIVSMKLKAVAEMELAITLSPDDAHRIYYQTCLLPLALNANELDKAKKAAEELLKDSHFHKDDRNYGNAMYYAHDTLGKVALRLDDVKEAKQQLLAAGQVPGSPLLNTVGPDLTLARLLLQRGERKTVVQYLNSISKFWEGKQGQIERWITRIEAGDTTLLEDKLGPE